MIQQVDLPSILPVRQQVLRDHKPVSDCYFDEDQLPGSCHFAYFIKDKVAGVLSLYPQDQQLSVSSSIWRLRGMAILPAYQGQGIGGAMLDFVIDYLSKDKKAYQLWCNARLSAQKFYCKRHFEVTGLPFVIPEAGPHVVMIKNLIP